MKSPFVCFLSLLGLISFLCQAPPLAWGQRGPGDSEYHITSVIQDVPPVFNEVRNIIDIPWIDTESGLMRLDPSESLYSNDVHCWPSVGGIIIAQRVHAVELAYIGLDRFHTTPRSLNKTEEDPFCMKLRKIGGKWWESWEDSKWPIGLR